ncbi:MAG: hypothetical protein ACYTET_04210, partial [Planctomycetota bacterium]
MRTNKCLNHTATIIKTLCALGIILFLAGIIQLIACEIYYEFSRERIRTQQADAEAKRTPKEIEQWEIDESQKEFTPDGTVYLVQQDSF